MSQIQELNNKLKNKNNKIKILYMQLNNKNNKIKIQDDEIKKIKEECEFMSIIISFYLIIYIYLKIKY